MQPMGGYGPPQGYDPNQPQPGYDPNQPQPGYDPNQPPYGQQPYPNAGGSGAFGAMGGMPGQPGMPQGPPMGGSMAPGGYGSMTPQGVQQAPPTPAQDLLAKLKQNSIPKIVAGLLFIIGGILYLAEDDDPPPPKKKPVATLDGGQAIAAGSGSSSSGPLVAPPVMPVQPAWPAGVPCPPPNWPPNTPLPCTPNNVGQQTDPPPARDGGKTPKDASGPSLPAGTKTLERQAVDYVSAGETAKAAAAYEELVRREPQNKVYAEAARILRAKLDAGTP
jgi:hypothetical protein